MNPSINSNTNSRVTLVILLLIFIVPMLLAGGLYFIKDKGWQTTNYGILITPPLQLADLSLRQVDDITPFPMQSIQKTWLMLYLSPVTCDKLCALNLYEIHQIHIALGKNQDRMQRLLVTYPQTLNLTAEKSLALKYPGTLQAVVQPTQLQQFLGKILFQQLNSEQGGLFIVDPLGNVMLHYSPHNDPEKILQDLNRLLGVSQIG